MTEQARTSIWKNFGPLIILILGGSFVYALPFFRYYYYDAFLSIFKINNTQMGNLQSVYGALAVISYLIGGFLADRISARKLISFSLFATGALGLWLYTIPSYQITLLIHALWGIFTILTFWPAMVKAVRMLATADEQGKAFGFLESGRGISNAIHMTAALALFGYLTGKYSSLVGLKGVIISYSIICFIVGFLVYAMLKDNKPDVKQDANTPSAPGIGATLKVLAMPHTWMIILIMFCSYSMNTSFYYITPYATQILGAAPILGAAMTIMANYVRPFASAGSGVLGDQKGCSKIIAMLFILMIIGLLGLIMVPASYKGAIALVISFSICTYVSMYGIQALHYTLLEEGSYPLELSGTAVGVVATLGYLPEVITPLIAGRLLDAFPGVEGFHYFFYILIALATFGFFITLVWMAMTKEKRAAILAMKNKTRLEKKPAGA